MANVLMLLDEEFPPDARVNKEIKSFVEAGHYVYLSCISTESRPTFEQKDGWEIHRMQMSKFKRKFAAVILVVPIYFWMWKHFIWRIFRNISIDIVHVNDLPLSKIGYSFSQKKKCKLVLDQHEFYSDWIIQTAHMNTSIGKIAKAFSFWKKYERKYLLRSDLVCTVADPLRENYIKRYQLPKEKIITIPNTPSLRIFNDNNIKKEIIDRYKNDFIIFYAGGIDILRGIDVAIQALPAIRKVIPNIKLVLAGKIVKPYDPLTMAKELKIEDIVEFIGWINECDLPSYIKASRLCFHTPPNTSEEVNRSIATKVYQYSAMKVPQIVGQAKLMKEFVIENGLGFSVSNHTEFAACVIAFSQGTLKTSFSKNPTILGWEETVEPLLEFYNNH